MDWEKHTLQRITWYMHEHALWNAFNQGESNTPEIALQQKWT